MKQQKMLKTNKGITLIALVITIIVMLILVAVTISMAVNGGLFDYAGNAVGETKNAIANESEGYDKYVQDMLIKYGVEEQTVTNPYEANGWEYAWTCTDGVWSEIINKGETAEGDVVAKIYKTGNKAPAIEEIEIPEGDEYHLIVEGQGNMGDLFAEDDNAEGGRFHAWMKLMEEAESEETIPIPYYITEIIVCDGIANIPLGFAQQFFSLRSVVLGNSVKVIGAQAFYVCYNLESVKILGYVTEIADYAFLYCYDLENINIPNSVTSIGEQAFDCCTSLKSINIPDGLTSLGKGAFRYNYELTNVKIGKNLTIIPSMTFLSCTNLKNIEIPNNITNIENTAFADCENLSKIKFLTEDASKITIGEQIFNNVAGNAILPAGSKIYVLSEEMKTKLEGRYDSTKTTVEVVTLEQMNQI